MSATCNRIMPTARHWAAGQESNRGTAMPKGSLQDLPSGVTRKTRTRDGKVEKVVTSDGVPVFRVRVWDPTLKKQVERNVAGLDAAKELLGQFSDAKRTRPGQLQAKRIKFVDVAARYLVAYKTRRDGTP